MADVKQFTINNVNYNVKDETARNAIEDLVYVGTTPASSYTDILVAPTSSTVQLVTPSELQVVDNKVTALQAAVGSPLVAATVSAMTDHDKIYVYTGSETGYTAGHWYYWTGSFWNDGGIYNSVAVETDKTLTVSDMAADAKVTGEEIDKISGSTRNLFAGNYVDGVSINSTTHKVQSTTGGAIVYIPCEENKTYTVSKTAGLRFSAGTTTAIPVVGDTVNDYYGRNTASSITITTSTGANYLVAWVYLSTQDTGITLQQMLASVQIELGDTATEYIQHETAVDLVARADINVLDDAIDKIEQETQAAVNNAYSESHLETQDYFPDEINVSDLLKLEKVKCIHHDNFARADNASEIGDNGSNVMEVPLLMPYGTLSNVSAGTLNVGINSNRAVSSTSGNVPDANVTIKTVDPGQFPYKLLVACDDVDGTYGSVALGIESVGKYVLVNFTKNLVTIASNATTQITDSASVTHSSGVPVYEIYVYKNRIAIYNIGVKLVDITADMTSTLCGMRFRAGNNIASSQPYAFTEFCVFLPEQWKQDGFDRAWENYESITVTPAAGQTDQQATEQRNINVAKSLGTFQTYTTYGITFETGNTVNSGRSVRFELHDTDPQHSNGVRSEIVPIRPQKDITLHTKILDFDVFFNASYDYDTNSDLIMQMHDVPDGINIGGLSPGIALVVYQDNLCITTQGSGTKVLTTEEKPTVKRTVLTPLPKNQWTHITIFLREGYETAHNPVVAVWVNNKLKTIDRNINAYNEPWGSYIKFGVYKGWRDGPTEVSERVILFDNVHFWF